MGIAGMTTSQVTLGPCSMLAPHYHPNAEEVAHIMSGEWCVVLHCIERCVAFHVSHPNAAEVAHIMSGEW